MRILELGEIMKSIITLVKQETLLFISALLAVFSFLVQPNIRKTIASVDLKTLLSLLLLMVIVAGFRQAGFFQWLTNTILKKVSNLKNLVLVLVGFSFFISMLVTNDVALIMLVPLAISILKKLELKRLIFTIVLMTIAANMGSSLTIIGNSQNLYLFQYGHFKWFSITHLMFPYVFLTGLLLVIFIYLLLPNQMIRQEPIQVKMDIKSLLFLLVLFSFTFLFIIDVLPVWSPIIIIIFLLMFDRKLFYQVDYALLLTFFFLFLFLFLFLFIGNINQIPLITNSIHRVLSGHEVIVTVILSQLISNVPSAIALTNYTRQISDLVIGTNLGGLGTLIASMASLISYKYIVKEKEMNRKSYLLMFSLYNVVVLLVLLTFHYLTSN